MSWVCYYGDVLPSAMEVGRLVGYVNGVCHRGCY